MAEQVNRRIEEMINELEQMGRMNLFDDEEIKEISRKRKEFEYHIQRRVKAKEDYVQYIAYELALLENISFRRKQRKLTEKKREIEYAIAQRLNRLFKQFIYRFQNDVEIYFEYIRFCKSVGFLPAISGIIGQMLQVHGDKPKMWQLASKWESEEQNNLDSARNFLLKGLQRHPDSEVLYVELFNIELITLTVQAESEEEKEKLRKRADIVWRNAAKNVDNVSILFKLYDLCLKYEVTDQFGDEIKQEIWSRRDNQDVWSYIASKELEGSHWKEIDEFVEDDNTFSPIVNNIISIYEEALQKFPEEKLCTKFIHELLGLRDNVCNDAQKIKAVKHAWFYGHENSLLTNDMYAFGMEILKLENTTSNEELSEILEAAIKKKPNLRSVWQELILLNKNDEKRMLSILQEATKVMINDLLYLYNLVLDNITSSDTLKSFYKRFQSCENVIMLAVKPKLLQKMYEHSGLKAARDLYDDLIKTPPIQIEVHKVMIEIEKSQEKVNLKNIRKYFECYVQNYGNSCIDVWTDYMKFEVENGNAKASAALYRRALGGLKKELADEFIKVQTLAKIK